MTTAAIPPTSSAEASPELLAKGDVVAFCKLLPVSGSVEVNARISFVVGVVSGNVVDALSTDDWCVVVPSVMTVANSVVVFAIVVAVAVVYVVVVVFVFVVVDAVTRNIVVSRDVTATVAHPYVELHSQIAGSELHDSKQLVSVARERCNQQEVTLGSGRGMGPVSKFSVRRRLLSFVKSNSSVGTVPVTLL